MQMGSVVEVHTDRAPSSRPSAESLVGRTGRHLWAHLIFALVAYGVTFPVWPHPDRLVLGSGLGDNASAIWNFWWAQQVMQGMQPSWFWTDVLFAPLGTSLVLHSFSWLPAAVNAASLPKTTPVAAYNFWLAFSLFLNGALTYVACYRVTGRRGPSLFGGLLFALAPFLVVRIQGHLNVLSAWPLPLIAIVSDAAWRRGTRARGLLLGLSLGIVAYVDYYYFVFCATLAVLLWGTTYWSVQVVTTAPTTARRRSAYAMLSGAALVAAVAVAVTLTGGTSTSIAGLTVSLRSTFNLRLIAWLLCVVAGGIWFMPRAKLITSDMLGAKSRDAWTVAALGAVAALLVIWPLVAAAYHLWMSGDYATQRYQWRSAPPGIDVASLVLGNPTSLLMGGLSQRAYEAFAIDRIESVAWLGLCPMVLLGLGWRSRASMPQVQRWLVVLFCFSVWALGPYLMAFGWNTGWLLPQTALRFIPVLSNARIPGRAFAAVVFAVAVVTSLVLAHHEWFRVRGRLALMVGLLLVDFWPAPYPVTTLDVPSWVTRLAAMPRGTVLDVPWGLRDGFGERGHLDHRLLFYQTQHEHPMAGGFVARLSPHIWRRYERDPVLGPFLKGDNTQAQSSPQGASALPSESLACAVRYVAIAQNANPGQTALVNAVFVLRPIVADASRALYSVEGYRPPYCVPPSR